MPLPIVPATAVPNTNAAMKFQNAAHATARNGVSTRVETTVAIEFAASCQPFENSNASVRNTTPIKRGKLYMKGSGALQNHAFDDVGYVLTLVYCGFDDLENFLPLDDLDGIALFVEKLCNQRAAQAVALVFTAIDLDGDLQCLFGCVQRMDALRHFFGGADQHFHQLDGAFANRIDAIKHEAAGRSIDQIDHVVQPATQLVNVFAIKRR